jgi:hypothetical protein
MAGRDFGGKITVTGSTGYRLSLRGTVTILGAHQSNDVVTNQDGRADRIITPDAPAAELVFADDGLNFDTLLNADRHNITIVEDKTGVTHMFTSAFWTGKPSSNRINGELSQLGIRSDYYRRLG